MLSSDEENNEVFDKFIKGILQHCMDKAKSDKNTIENVSSLFDDIKKELGLQSSKDKLVETQQYLGIYGHQSKLSFDIISLDDTLEEFSKRYCEEVCYKCCKTATRSAVCLTCGTNMCITSCDRDFQLEPRQVGNLTIHSRACGAGVSIFISKLSGTLICMFTSLAVESKSPYQNKYGETFDANDFKSFDTFSLDINSYNNLRKQFLNFEIPNLVVTKRSKSDRKIPPNVL